MHEWMLLLLVLGLLAALATGYPVAFALGGTALLIAGIGIATGTFDAVLPRSLPRTACSAP
jgi:TRAP-type mannitol/chloroaromatic compound transport system permease large subunit